MAQIRIITRSRTKKKPYMKTWAQEVRKSINGILSYKHLKFLKYCRN